METKTPFGSENPEAVREAVQGSGLFNSGAPKADEKPKAAPQAPPAEQSKAVAIQEKNIADSVLAKVTAFQREGTLTLPEGYAVENHLKAAWLVLLEVKDRNGGEALKICTKDSIAQAMLDMVLQGLSVQKRQAYFIVYGNKLTLMRSYFGTIALAKKVGMKTEPVANVVYEGDVFQFEIDPLTGLHHIVKHEQQLGNIDDGKILGAYCIIDLPDGRKDVTIMPMAQIRKSWEQGATKGNSPAHKNFTSEMAKRTVINKALKIFINSSDDGWLYSDKPDDMDTDTAAQERNARVASGAGSRTVKVEEVEFEEVTGETTPPAPTPSPEPVADVEPPYAK